MYEVIFYKGNYRWRQKQANRDKCAAYVEHHFNSAVNPMSSYAVVITGYLASETTKNWGRWYANRVGMEFGIPVAGNGGVLVGGYNGRGNGNLKHTRMPAILLEPLFASNPEHAEWIRNEEGQDTVAKILTESIMEFFPEGSRIGFSVGHKYKTSRPKDRGAPVYGGGAEADYAEIVMEKAKVMLESDAPIIAELIPEDEDVPDNDIRVIKDGKELWLHSEVDEDDDVVWDEENRILYITSL